MIDAAVRDFLAADTTLVAMLGAFAGQPAIFVHGVVPASFVRGVKPYIALRDDPAGPYLDGDANFFSADVDILVLKSDEGDAADVEAAAWRVRTVLHGALIAPTGYVSGGTSVTGPQPDDPDDLSFGRRLTATVVLTET